MWQERFKFWREDTYFDEQTRRELRNLCDEHEIEDRFYMDLEFGTAGLRGKLGAGTNRMNRYVIRKVTQGLADYISSEGEALKSRGVVIAFDSRYGSKEFSREAALVLAAQGIKAYLFEDLRPTPVLSFAVRQLHAIAGINITASHNAKEYNGYKLYWEDGGQIPPEHNDEIYKKIAGRQEWRGIVPAGEQEALSSGLLTIIGAEIDHAYEEKVKELVLYPDVIREHGQELTIVYSPLHGTGNLPVRRILAATGFSRVHVVAEQELPDPEFPTVVNPNPETKAAFDLARRDGKKLAADLLLVTDPDADRLGAAIQDAQGEYVQLTGNQIGVILLNYILQGKKCLGILPDKPVAIKTIVSTGLADQMAECMGCRVENVLTGFKFIAEKVKEMEQQGSGVFQFGFEESYGFLAGDFVRDKDAVIASLLLSEAALFYKIKEGRTLLELLEEIYRQYGYYIDDQVSFTLEGKEGKQQIQGIMKRLQALQLRRLGDQDIAQIEDYTLRKGHDILQDKDYDLTLPRADVLRYTFQSGGYAIVRPSGTEPKIKFYFSIQGTDREKAQQTLAAVKENLLQLLEL
ncbi:MAG: phospho-sugar mutase [Peptococcaceae bacterium]|jgi:phosphoglucomutase|nr:phospho-sugar mutase [Peptococcaceae bacterium]